MDRIDTNERAEANVQAPSEGFATLGIEMYEFHIWNLDIGEGDYDTNWHAPNDASGSWADRIEFKVGERIWTLRKLFRIGDKMLPLAPALPEPPAELVTPHAALQVSAVGFSPQDAEAEVRDVCWLLGLAFNRLTFPHARYLVHGAERQFQGGSSPRQSFGGTSPALISNQGKRLLMSFAELAYGQFILDRKWWTETFDWALTAASASPVEASILIYMMMLDRISDRILKTQKFPKQIGDDLDTTLSGTTSRHALQSEVSWVFRFWCDNWSVDRSESVLKTIEEWNNKPSFPNKIAEGFSQLGLQKPEKKIIGERHALLHGGKLRIYPDNPVIVLSHVATHVLTALLRMLKYSGPFFPRGMSERRMEEFIIVN